MSCITIYVPNMHSPLEHSVWTAAPAATGSFSQPSTVYWQRNIVCRFSRDHPSNKAGTEWFATTISCKGSNIEGGWGKARKELVP